MAVPSRRELPVLFLRVEGVVLLALAILLYARRDGSWWVFLFLVLLPDVGILGYASRNNRVGAIVYNLFHTYLPPAVLAVIGVVVGSRPVFLFSLIWFAHIGLDRMLGYGLKYPSGFRDTHLGRIGRLRASRPAKG
jgi:hypothetical protein